MKLALMNRRTQPERQIKYKWIEQKHMTEHERELGATRGVHAYEKKISPGPFEC